MACGETTHGLRGYPASGRLGGLVAVVAVVACGPRGSVGGSGSGTGTGTTGAVVPDLPPGPGCGNGVVEPPEQCDDGNTVDGDGCQGDCTYPPYHGERVFAGDKGTCVSLEGGNRIRCWGSILVPYFDEEKQEYVLIGDDEPAALRPDVEIPAAVRTMDIGFRGGAVVFEDGEVRVWSWVGEPYSAVIDALLGQGTPGVDVETYGLEDSVVLPLPGPAKQVAWGGFHACAVLEDGALYCWGYNGSGKQAI